MAVMFALIPVAGCNKVTAVSAYIISGFLSGANMAGYLINATDIAPKYAG